MAAGRRKGSRGRKENKKQIREVGFEGFQKHKWEKEGSYEEVKRDWEQRQKGSGGVGGTN